MEPPLLLDPGRTPARDCPKREQSKRVPPGTLEAENYIKFAHIIHYLNITVHALTCEVHFLGQRDCLS